jgi:hypothetical protein
MGAAAIVGDQRLTIANLDTEATKLASAGQAYPSVFTLSQQQITQQTLSWLIRFKINDQLASSAGISVTNRQAQVALAGILAQVQQSSGSLRHQQCLAAKSLNIKVNPQFGRMNYSNYAVVAAADTVSRPSGAVKTTSLSGLAPAC